MIDFFQSIDLRAEALCYFKLWKLIMAGGGGDTGILERRRHSYYEGGNGKNKRGRFTWRRRRNGKQRESGKEGGRKITLRMFEKATQNFIIFMPS